MIIFRNGHISWEIKQRILQDGVRLDIEISPQNWWEEIKQQGGVFSSIGYFLELLNIGKRLSNWRDKHKMRYEAIVCYTLYRPNFLSLASLIKKPKVPHTTTDRHTDRQTYRQAGKCLNMGKRGVAIASIDLIHINKLPISCDESNPSTRECLCKFTFILIWTGFPKTINSVQKLDLNLSVNFNILIQRVYWKKKQDLQLNFFFFNLWLWTWMSNITNWDVDLKIFS